MKNLLLGILLLFLLTGCFLQPKSFDEQQWLRTVEETSTLALYLDNIEDGRFHNPWLVDADRSFWSFLRWRFSPTAVYTKEAWTNTPQFVPSLMQRINTIPPERDFISWIGHATFLIRLDGTYWLTDPIFSQRAFLPKRITQPAIQAADLAGLNGKLHVVISHNHYDHLDVASIRDLPRDTSFYVPLGVKPLLADLTDGPIAEMDWWEELELSENVTITCLPAQHWSLRVFQGFNRSLWASFMLSGPSHVIYFGGDSGYFKGYREIGEQFEKIDYALLPITAYDPRWFMHYNHMNTTEAIRAFQDLRAKYFIPTQWGTFHLGDNPPGLPPLDLRKNIAEQKLDPSAFLLLDIGEIHLL